MSILRRPRLLAAALLCGAYVVAFAIELTTDRDGGWPVSIYPMYSDLRTAPTYQVVTFYGVRSNPDGTEIEEPIRGGSLYPVTPSRIERLFYMVKPAQRRELLRFLLDRNPQYSAVRAFDEEWQYRAESMVARKLAGELVRQ